MRCELGCDGWLWVVWEHEMILRGYGLGRVWGSVSDSFGFPFFSCFGSRYTYGFVRQQRDGTMVCSGLPH